METPPDIEILLTLNADEVPYSQVASSLRKIESILASDIEEEISRCCDELELPTLVKDASLYRLSQEKNENYLVRSVDKGSVAVFAVLTAVSYYIVDRTLGESIRSGYADSKLHDKLSKWITASLDQKVDRIEKKLRDTHLVGSSRLRIGKFFKSVRSENKTIFLEKAVDTKNLPPKYSALALPPPESKDSDEPKG